MPDVLLHPLYFYLHFNQDFSGRFPSHSPVPDTLSILLTHLPTFPECKRSQYGPLCSHPNASCVFVTFPPMESISFQDADGRTFLTVQNPDGCTMLDVNRALADLWVWPGVVLNVYHDWNRWTAYRKTWLRWMSPYPTIVILFTHLDYLLCNSQTWSAKNEDFSGIMSKCLRLRLIFVRFTAIPFVHFCFPDTHFYNLWLLCSYNQLHLSLFCRTLWAWVVWIHCDQFMLYLESRAWSFGSMRTSTSRIRWVYPGTSLQFQAR